MRWRHLQYCGRGAVGEKVKIGSGIYIDGGMLVTSEYLTPELDVTYILERDGKEMDGGTVRPDTNRIG
jgi:hypothetical protein